MADKIKLSAQKREIFGRKVKKLRQQNLIPANIFGNKIKSTAITVSFGDLKQAYKQAGETSVIDLSIEGEKESRPVLISEIQTDPISKQILHTDFRQVDLTQKIAANVPVELIGEAEAVNNGAIIVTLKDEIEVEALPNDIPDKIELNISSLKAIGDSITAANISIDKSKVLVKLEDEEILVQAQEAMKEEVVEEVPIEEEVEGETKGEEAKEGEEKTKKGEVDKKEEVKSEDKKEEK